MLPPGWPLDRGEGIGHGLDTRSGQVPASNMSLEARTSSMTPDTYWLHNKTQTVT